MAKSESKSVGATEAFDAADVQALSLDDIPDEMPLLNAGRWAFQLISYKVETKDGREGPYTVARFDLDPVEPVADVDDPVADYDSMRQFHRVYMTKTSDMIALKKFLRAFGVEGGNLRERGEDGTWTFPAFEAAKGNIAHATVYETVAKGGPRAGQTEVRLSDFVSAE